MERSAIRSGLCFPAYDETLVAAVVVVTIVSGVEKSSRANDSFTQDLEFDVADEWDATPCDGDSPQGCAIESPPFDDGEVGMCGWKKVEVDTRGENAGW